MNQSDLALDPAATLDMTLARAARICLVQLPALAQRRLRGYLADIDSLHAGADDEQGQRMAGNLFGVLANASVHCGGANTLRPLFAELARLRIYRRLRSRLPVRLPQTLAHGAPDLIAEVSGQVLWIDVRARRAGVLQESNHPRLLVLDRSGMARREPALRLGQHYDGEFHLIDVVGSDMGSGACWMFEQQPQPGDGRDDGPDARFSAAMHAGRVSCGEPALAFGQGV